MKYNNDLSNLSDEICDIIKSSNNDLKETILKELCKINGHDFGNWEKTDLALEGIPMPIGPIICWKRVCNRCGFIERVNQNPEESKGCKMFKKLLKKRNNK